MKMILTFLASVFSFSLLAQNSTATRLVKEGTIIKVALLSDINGKDVSVGQAVNFELSENIVVDNDTVIFRGAKVIGTITEAQKSKALGKKGKLAFTIDYLYLADGRPVRLRNQVEKNINGSGAAIAAGAVLITPVALLIPGKNAKYFKGDVFTAYIDKDVAL